MKIGICIPLNINKIVILLWSQFLLYGAEVSFFSSNFLYHSLSFLSVSLCAPICGVSHSVQTDTVRMPAISIKWLVLLIWMAIKSRQLDCYEFCTVRLLSKWWWWWCRWRHRHHHLRLMHNYKCKLYAN